MTIFGFGVAEIKSYKSCGKGGLVEGTFEWRSFESGDAAKASAQTRRA